MQSYGYKLAASLVLLFVCLQFIINADYHPSRLLQAADPPPFKYDRPAFSLEDMEQQGVRRGYLSRSDYVYNVVPVTPAAVPSPSGSDGMVTAVGGSPHHSSPSLPANASQLLLKECPPIPPALGE